MNERLQPSLTAAALFVILVSLLAVIAGIGNPDSRDERPYINPAIKVETIR